MAERAGGDVRSWRVRDAIGLAVMVVAIVGLHFLGAWIYYGAKR